MEKTIGDNNVLVDYNDDEEVNLNATTAAENEDISNKGHYAGVGSNGFQSFFLKEEIMKGIAECGFEHPSEVQSQCIPKVLLRKDILCQARSGMGKTCVFVISMLNMIQHSDTTSAIVFCHTREMVVQVAKEFIRLAKYLPTITIKSVFGGVPLNQNIASLKEGCDILVGTPGRVADLLHHKALHIDKLKYFVIDECDRMIENLNTRKDIQEVFRATPLDKQTMMFTATLSAQIKPICLKYLQAPEVIEVDDKKLTLHGLRQFFMKVDEKSKNRRLTEVLDNTEFNQLVIYTSSNQRAMALSQLLNAWCFPCLAITSKMTTEQRMRHFIQFKENKKPILVTTDLFGRGVDFEKINMVVNYDFPATSDAYLHRVGRAGRFGTTGLTVSFVGSVEDGKVLSEVNSRFETNMKELVVPITKESFNV